MCVCPVGKWFVSTGKDNLLNAWRTPYGSSIFQVSHQKWTLRHRTLQPLLTFCLTTKNNFFSIWWHDEKLLSLLSEFKMSHLLVSSSCLNITGLFQYTITSVLIWTNSQHVFFCLTVSLIWLPLSLCSVEGVFIGSQLWYLPWWSVHRHRLGGQEGHSLRSHLLNSDWLKKKKTNK